MVWIAIKAARAELHPNLSPAWTPETITTFTSDAPSCLANSDHALGNGDLRVAFSLQNSDVVSWRLKLMREASHSVLFADVMGGRLLDTAAEILEVKIKTIPHFQAVILHYAREDYNKPSPRLDRLAVDHPDRVGYFFISQDNYMIHWPGLEKVHIKFISADYGKYFTLGSSAWVELLPYHDYDSDFIFEDCAGTIGQRVWDDVVNATGRFVHQFLELYKKNKVDTDALLRMGEFRTPTLCAKVGLDMCGFPYSCSRLRNVSIPIPKPAWYLSGPGQQHNARFMDSIVEAVNTSTSRIVIMHFFFILPERLSNALKNAAMRGVRIVIVTQGRAREGKILKRLAEVGISAANDIDAVGILTSGKNVTVHKFMGDLLLKTYHKKVIIVDDTVFAGSANLGPKSMMLFTDLEVGFQVHSKALADEQETIALRDAATYCAGIYGVSLSSWALARVWHFVRAFTTFANY